MRRRPLLTLKSIGPRLPWRTVRARLTVLYGALFLASAAVLFVIAGVLWGSATNGSRIVANSRVPTNVLIITGLQPPPPGAASFLAFPGGPASAASRQHAFASGSLRAQYGALPGVPNPKQLAQVRARSAAVVGQLQVLAEQQRNSDGRALLFWAAIALGIMTIVSVGLGWLLARRVLRPLRTITTSVRDISATNLHERLDIDGPDDELKELGDTFDQLLERLDRSFQSQRQFVANASHELRTPLATMRATLDVAVAKPGPIPEQTTILAGRMRQELDHVDRLLEGFLVLARAQSGVIDDDVPVALDHLVSSALAQHADAIGDRALRVSQEGSPEALVIGNETLLGRMVENLIDNAVRHNEPDGWIHVRTEVDTDMARLSVENGGPVLDDEALAALVQPFRRLAADRTGSDNGLGLGLSIVSSIVETHGGCVELHAIPDGGFRAVVELPLARLAELATVP